MSKRCGPCGAPTRSRWIGMNGAPLCAYCAGFKSCAHCGSTLDGAMRSEKRCRTCGGPIAKRREVKRANVDYQRSRVYEAERAAFRHSDARCVLRRDDAQRFAGEIVNANARRRGFAPRLVSVTVNRRRTGAIAIGGDTIEFGRGQALRLWVLLHECAHLTSNGVAHGPEFCAEYLRTVHAVCGVEAAERLAREFLAHKVEAQSWR